MPIEQSSLLIVARVVEAGAVGGEGDRGVAAHRQLILQRLAGLHVQYMDAGFIGATLTYTVGHERAIAGNVRKTDTGVGVAAELGRSDEAPVFCRPAMPDIDGCLLLWLQPLGKEVAASALNRCAGAGHVFQ